MSKEDPADFVRVADGYRRAADYPQAFRVLRRGLEQNPEYVPGYELLGLLLLEQNRTAEAVVCFERLLELDRENATARRVLEEVARRVEARQSPPVRTFIARIREPRREANGNTWSRPSQPGWATVMPAENDADERGPIVDPKATPPVTASFTVGAKSSHVLPPAPTSEPEPEPELEAEHLRPVEPEIPEEHLLLPVAEDLDPFAGTPVDSVDSIPALVPEAPEGFAALLGEPELFDPRAAEPDPLAATLAEKLEPLAAGPVEKPSPNGQSTPQVPRSEAQELESALERHEKLATTHREPVAGIDPTAVALADLLVGLLEFGDPFFRGASSLTRLLTTAMARELKLPLEAVNAIALGAVLRDLGQLPMRGMLNRPGLELPAEARKNMERHVQTALAALEGIDLPDVTRDTIRSHHEHWDGNGYPEGLAGEAIPLGGRIVAVAETFVAMISARPHRLAKRVPVALDDIRSGAGTHFDPMVVGALHRVINSSGWRGPGFALRRHVLIVDPDESRAMVAATRLCAHGYLAEVAFNIASADERLEKSRVSAVVISSDLPGHDEAALLRQVRETARIALIPVIVTEAEDNERVAFLKSGADVCLRRFVPFEELKATLDALLRRENSGSAVSGSTIEMPLTRLQGEIRDFPVSWLLQVLNYDSRTAAVFLVTKGDEGAIYLERGNPRHAQTRTRSGEDALHAMLKWQTGVFHVEPDVRTDAETIQASLMSLLLNNAVEQDEATFFGQVHP